MKISDLPKMRCDGCGKCCGPVPVFEHEYVKILKYVTDHEIPLKQQGLACPLYQDKRCQVYEIRPFLCRIFGHTSRMLCLNGNNSVLPDRKVEKLMKRMIRKHGVSKRTLHHLVGDDPLMGSGPRFDILI